MQNSRFRFSRDLKAVDGSENFHSVVSSSLKPVLSVLLHLGQSSPDWLPLINRRKPGTRVINLSPTPTPKTSQTLKTRGRSSKCLVSIIEVLLYKVSRVVRSVTFSCLAQSSFPDWVEFKNCAKIHTGGCLRQRFLSRAPPPLCNQTVTKLMQHLFHRYFSSELPNPSQWLLVDILLLRLHPFRRSLHPPPGLCGSRFWARREPPWPRCSGP